MHAILLLTYCVGTSVAEDVGSNGAPATSSTVNTVDEGHDKKMLAKQVLPSTLLIGSATEFDLQCETDAEAEKKTKHRQKDRTTAVINRSVDSLSGGILVTTTASSLNSGEDVTDISAGLKTGSAAGNEVSNDKVLPLLKQRKNYKAKVSNKLCVVVFVHV